MLYKLYLKINIFKKNCKFEITIKNEVVNIKKNKTITNLSY